MPTLQPLDGDTDVKRPYNKRGVDAAAAAAADAADAAVDKHRRADAASLR
jgi:hypothetical protein